MAPSKLLLSLLLCSTSVFAVDFFYPNHLNQTIRYTLPGKHFSGPNGEGIWESYRSKSDPTQEIFNSSREIFPDAEATYNIDCNRNPNICLNVCYYAYCNGGGQGSYRQKKRSGRNVAPGCSNANGPNRCSKLHDPPNAQNGAYNCDEYPLASMEAGGTDMAATRCVPKGENSSAGSPFGSIAVGDDVTVSLGGNIPSFQGGFCEPLLEQGAADCTRDHGQPELQL